MVLGTEEAKIAIAVKALLKGHNLTKAKEVPNVCTVHAAVH